MNAENVCVLQNSPFFIMYRKNSKISKDWNASTSFSPFRGRGTLFTAETCIAVSGRIPTFPGPPPYYRNLRLVSLAIPLNLRFVSLLLYPCLFQIPHPEPIPDLLNSGLLSSKPPILILRPLLKLLAHLHYRYLSYFPVNFAFSYLNPIRLVFRLVFKTNA